MKTTKLLRNIVMVALGGLMAACSGGAKAAEPFKADPYKFVNTYRDMRIDGNGYIAEQYTTHRNDDFRNEYVIENVRALVVPIDFTDYPASGLPKGAAGSVEDLRKTVFGTQDELGWYSLSEYYKSASFGKCNVTGKVMDWFHINSSSVDFEKKYASGESGYVVGTNELVKMIQDYYLEHPEELGTVENGDDYNGDGVVDLKDFDANGDNYVDALIMIYSAPINTTGTMWWAYCSTRTNAGTNLMHPWMYRYFWCSFYFFYEKYGDADLSGDDIIPESHTLIHEFGHVLGLPDYYVTDYNSKDYDSLGGLDMESMNIGDHNAMSKSFFGWTYPTVVDGKATVTIRSTTDTGDYVIVPFKGKGYRDSILDQYIMIEFLTPTGVAYKDGVTRLQSGYPLYYSEAGVRISLVDARLGISTYNDKTGAWKFSGFTSTTTRPGSGTSIDLANTNTANTSSFPKYKLIEVLPATGKRISAYPGHGSQQAGDNTVLYKEGDVFGAKGVFDGFKGHGTGGEWDTPFGYKISIDKIDGMNSCTITVK